MTYSHMHARRLISHHLPVVAAATVAAAATAAATASAVAAAAGCCQEAIANERASDAARARAVIDSAAKSRASVVTQLPTPVRLISREDVAIFFFLKIFRSYSLYMR